MNLHYLQHVSFEGLGTIQSWADRNAHSVSVTRFYENEHLPSPECVDMLVIMGGPMGIYDYTEYPWLHEEKEFIRQAIAAGKPVLGVCLGAQLIADVCGARVFPGKQKEIGWFPLKRSDELHDAPFIQRADEIVAMKSCFPDLHRIMDSVLDYLSA